MTKIYTIRNIGESICKIYVELTVDQAQFLNDLFKNLNDSADGTYAPYISICENKND